MNQQMWNLTLRRDIAASSLESLCKNFIPVKKKKMLKQIRLFLYEVYGNNTGGA